MAQNNAQTRSNRGAVLVAGAGHSGSTLLGFMLGSHPDAFYAGEARKVRYLGDDARPAHKRSCKLCGPDCPIWGGFVPADSPDLYEQLSRRTGRGTIVDTTKNPAWIRERIAELDTAGVPAALVLLQRDGRAVVNSRLRKYPDRDVDQTIHAWVHAMDRARSLFDAHTGPKTVLRYEQLATTPEATLRAACADLGVPWDPAMLHWTARDQHVLGGNNGTQFLLARAKGDDAPRLAQPSRRHGDYYRAHGDGIRLDVRWRTELAPHALDRFDAIASACNRDLAWEVT